MSLWGLSTELTNAPREAILPTALCLELRGALDGTHPSNPVLDVDLPPRPELRLVQMEIVHRADPQDTPPRKGLAHTVHERAAGATEIVGHQLARGDGAALRVRGQSVAAAQVGEVGVGDGEVGREHGRRDLAAVRAVAHEGAEQARPLRREGQLHGAAEAGCCRRVLGRPAVGRAASERDVGFGLVGGGGHGKGGNGVLAPLLL